MKIDLEKFLTITALLATASVVDACSSDKAGVKGTSGTGGSDSGAGGTATGGKDAGATGTGGSSGKDSGVGSGATGGTDGGTDGSAPDAGGESCLADYAPPWSPPAGSPDGSSPDRCEHLPWSCSLDAGSEGTYSYGYAFCTAFTGELRPGILDAMTGCIEDIAQINEDPCSSSYKYSALDCLDAAVARACRQTIPPSGDAGGDLCDTIAGKCSGVTAVQCRNVISSFTDEGANNLVLCLKATDFSTAQCATSFWDCLLPANVHR